MSLSALKTHLASPNGLGRPIFSAPIGARAWASSITLPATAVLDFFGRPAALWSDDRSRGIFNGAAAALVGVHESDCSTGGDLWLERVDSQDRERVMSAWQSLQRGAATMVCSYRFIPPGCKRAVELQETARYLSATAPDEPVVLSLFELVEIRSERQGGEAMPILIHQIANSLQSIRSEVDLLRLFGALPQLSFETIVRGIETIHRLTAQLHPMNVAQNKRGVHRQAPAGANTAAIGPGQDEVLT